MQARDLADIRACTVETRLSAETEVGKDKGLYVGVEDQSHLQTDDEYDGLEDVWKEMSMVLETSKVFSCIHYRNIFIFILFFTVSHILTKVYSRSMLFFQDVPLDLPSDEKEDEGDCEHSFVLKDDLGYVCRVCGVIQRGIETIFDFQYNKVRFLFVDSYYFYFIIPFTTSAGKELPVWLCVFLLRFLFSSAICSRDIFLSSLA